MKQSEMTKKIFLSQVEDALEERQNSDRRKQTKGLPEDIEADRRKSDRRSDKKH